MPRRQPMVDRAFEQRNARRVADERLPVNSRKIFLQQIKTREVLQELADSPNLDLELRTLAASRRDQLSHH
ncbi:MAG: hypothetical protein KW802_04570 [Candidatus Doudnabacteria bacterium]|nr:hypothetical protein [Candidatus Doudnabacteria bacterium]